MKGKTGLDLDKLAENMGADLIGRLDVRHGPIGAEDLALEVAALLRASSGQGGARRRILQKDEE